MARVINGLARDQLLAGKIFHAREVATCPRQFFTRSRDRSSGTRHLGTAGIGGVGHPRDQRFVLGHGDFQRIAVDLEQQVALLHRLVLADGNLDHAATNLRRHQDAVRLDVGIVGADGATGRHPLPTEETGHGKWRSHPQPDWNAAFANRLRSRFGFSGGIDLAGHGSTFA